MEASNPTEFEYLEGSIPTEWDGNVKQIPLSNDGAVITHLTHCFGSLHIQILKVWS